MVMDSDERLIDSKAVAAMLGISERGVWRAAGCGAIPAPIKIRRSARWLKSELDEFFKRAKNTRNN